MSQKQQFGATRFLSRAMVSLVVGLLYVAACACPAVKEKNLRLGLANALLVLLGWSSPRKVDTELRRA